MSYVDLVETFLVKKEDSKPTVKRLKKTTQIISPDGSIDATPISEELPASTTIVVRPLGDSSNLTNYQTEQICSD